MSEENVAAARAIYAAWERGDYSSADWADPDIVYVQPDAPEAFEVRGVEAMGAAWSEWLDQWDEFRSEADEYIDAGDTVLILTRFAGRGKQSGVAVDGLPGAALMTFRDGRVTRLVAYENRDHAFEDAGLPPRRGND